VNNQCHTAQLKGALPNSWFLYGLLVYGVSTIFQLYRGGQLVLLVEETGASGENH
jgi:hypothetical protein